MAFIDLKNPLYERRLELERKKKEKKGFMDRVRESTGTNSSNESSFMDRVRNTVRNNEKYDDYLKSAKKSLDNINEKVDISAAKNDFLKKYEPKPYPPTYEDALKDPNYFDKSGQIKNQYDTVKTIIDKPITTGEKGRAFLSYAGIPDNLDTPKTVYRYKIDKPGVGKTIREADVTEGYERPLEIKVIGESKKDYWYRNEYGELVPIPKADVMDTLPDSQIAKDLNIKAEKDKEEYLKNKSGLQKWKERTGENTRNTSGGLGANSDIDTGSWLGNVSADLVGGALGYLTPMGTGNSLLSMSNELYSGAANIASKVAPRAQKVLPNIKSPLANKMLKGAAEGAGTFVPISLYESGAQDLEIDEAAKKLAIDVAMGGAFGAGFGAAGRGLEKVKGRIKENKLAKITPDEMNANIQTKYPWLRQDVNINTGNPLMDTIINNAAKTARTEITSEEPELTKLMDEILSDQPKQPVKKVIKKVEQIEQPQPQIKNLTPEQESKLKQAEIEYKDKLEYSNRHKDQITRDKERKAIGMEYAAKKREIIQGDKLISVEGGLTDIELSNKIKRLKSNHKGKEVVTPDGEAVLIGKSSYGKVGAKLQDGTVKYYPSEQLIPKNDVNEIIARQKAETQKTIEPIKQPQQQIMNQPQVQQQTQPQPQLNSTIPETTLKLKPTDTNSGLKSESKIYTNTLKNSGWNQAPESQKMLNDLEKTFDMKTDKDTIERVTNSLNNDYKGTYERIAKNGIQSKDDVIAAGAIARDMANNGDAELMYDFVNKSVQPQAREAGQMIQGFASWKPDSLEGAVFKASKLAKEYQELFKKNRPEQYAKIESKINSELDKIKNIIAQDGQNGIMMNLQLFGENLKKVTKLPKNYVKKIVDTAVKTGKDGRLKYNLDDITDIIKDRYGIPTFTKEDTKQMFKYWREAQKHKKDSYKYRENMYRMGTVMPAKIPSTLGDYLRAIQAWNLFGNTMTLSKILQGNIVSSTVKNIEEAAGALIDKGVSKLTGKRTIAAPSLITQGKGMIKRTKEIGKDWINNVDTNIFNDTFDFRQTTPFKNKVLRKIDNTSKAIFALMENTFKQGKYDDVIRQEMKIHNINAKKSGKALLTEPTEEMILKAKKEAEKVAFADSNFLVDALYGLRRGLNKVQNTILNKTILEPIGRPIQDPEKFGVGNYLLPVLRTPANMAAWVGEHLPINPQMVRGVIKAAKGKEGQRDIIEGIVKGVLGTGLGVAGYDMGKDFNAFGGPDKDADAREFNAERGQQPYSVTVGDKNISTDWLQPYAIPFNFGVELGQNKKNKNPFTAATDSLIKQAFLQSLNSIMGGGGRFGSPSENIQDTMLNTTSQAVPFGSLVNQIGKAVDPYKRETDNDPLKRVIARTPLRFTLPEKTDTKGEKVPEDSAASIWVNPSKLKDVKRDKLSDEMDRLYKDSGEVKQFIPKLPNKKEIKGNVTEFTQEEILKAQKEFSTTLISDLTDEIQSSDYLEAENDEERAAILNKIINKRKQEIIDDLLDRKGINSKTGLKD